MRSRVTPREKSGPPSVEQPIIGNTKSPGNPMALLGFVLSIVSLLVSPLTFSTHIALGFAIPLVPAAVTKCPRRARRGNRSRTTNP